MRRRPVAPILVAAFVTASAAAAPIAGLDAARDVRGAIPAIEAYRAEHGTYSGMTLAKLRRWDRSVRRIVIRVATRSRYCVQSTAVPLVHFDGPHGKVRKGRCGVKGPVVPLPPSPSPPTPNPDVSAAQQRLRSAVILFEVYYADNGTYAGATIEKLRRYDVGLRDVTIAWTQPKRYCIETPAGTSTYHLLGPAEAPKSGRCPAA